jgi:hypothetical protein
MGNAAIGLPLMMPGTAGDHCSGASDLTGPLDCKTLCVPVARSVAGASPTGASGARGEGRPAS